MVWTLLKKQLMGALAYFTMGKDGKKRSKKVAIAFAVLILYAMGSMGMLYWQMADMLCEPLVAGDMSWVYFAMMGTMATALGIVLGLFIAKSRLYEAKDNDLLLSMPIPSWVILLSRTVGQYAFTLMIEAIAFIPAIARYFTIVGFSFIPVLCSVAVLLVLPCLALAISFTLGWLIALIQAKLPGKNAIEMVFAVAFMIGYFAVYSKVNEYLGYVVANGEAVGKVMQTVLYPFSQLGKACVGDGVALLFYILMFAGAFALVYWVLSLTYLQLATAKKSVRKVKYTGKGYKGRSAILAIAKKEIVRFCKNSMLLLNAYMGSIMLVILPFITLFDRATFTQLAAGFEGDFSLILAVILCALTSTNLQAACSISIEGDNLDTLRVLPVRTEDIFLAKGLASVLVAGLPAVFSCVFLCILFEQSFTVFACILLAVVVCVAFFAAGGIAVNLLLPNLHWTNEVVVVKQSASTVVAMFGGVGVVAALVGGYFLFGKYLPAWGYLLVCTAVMALAFVGVCLFLKKKGVKLFEVL